jgi:hypothetical protein
MAHPHNEHRQSKVEHARVAHITKGYATGGAVHSDAVEDAKLVKGLVKKIRAQGRRQEGQAPRRSPATRQGWPHQIRQDQRQRHHRAPGRR